VRNAYKVLVRRLEGKRPCGRTRREWEGNITANLREIGWEAVDWMHLAQDRDQWQAVGKTVMNLQAPRMAGNLIS
jgi:hypothetical protein